MNISDIVSDLVSFRSTHNNPQGMRDCLEYCEKFFSSDKKSGKAYIQKYNNRGVQSLVIGNAPGKKFDVIMLGHIDTVDGEDRMFHATVRDGKIFGRGIADMKAFVATSMMVLQDALRENIDKKVALMIVSDEELGGVYGTKYLVEKVGYRAKAVLVPDDGEKINQIVIASKNILSLKFTAKGKEAHGCRPWDGKNAILMLWETFRNLSEYFPNNGNLRGTQWVNSLNLGTIKGGTASNEVAGSAEMEVNIRFTEQNTKDEVLNWVDKALVAGVNYEVTVWAEGVFTDLNNQYVKNYLEIMKDVLGCEISFLKSGGGTDGRYFAYQGIPVITHQGTGYDSQGCNENVSIESLFQLMEIQSRFIRSVQ